MPSMLITGGVGFIGTNVADYFSKRGYKIIIIDDLSRKNVEKNLNFLKHRVENLTFIKAKVQDTNHYLDQLKSVDVVIHLAGQTAVTTSIANPSLDFQSNAVGSFNLLEALRVYNPTSIVLYASTNKVYGNLDHHSLIKNEQKKRYENTDFPQGVSEEEQTMFISPYGCSKGVADIYMQDYARIYDLSTVVFRQSCIYGPHQMGVEDQGWVAHFVNLALKKHPISIFGDGYQVRDLLFVDDLIGAYELAINSIQIVKGGVFNIGGGVSNSSSLLSVVSSLEEIMGEKINLDFKPERAGDQKYFVSDNSLFSQKTGWKPKVPFDEGLEILVKWLKKQSQPAPIQGTQK